ncbi:MAG TPA: hypothetical protein VJH22_04910 [Candidatus Nanoarchaeia archaeon]|nr:hypothetical protein [Candidatus Nanoarchaeia archaeon]
MRTLIVLVIVLMVLSSCKATVAPGTYDALAKCISSKDVKMYGAFWCPKCAKQKESFGDSFKFIPYIECDPRGDNGQPDLCLEKNVLNYPHWEFSDGTSLEQVLSPEELAARVGC